MVYGSRILNCIHGLSVGHPVSLLRPSYWLSVLLFFSKPMNRLSRIDSLIDELNAIRQLLSDVEYGTQQWKNFDRLEDRLCAELASEYAEAD